MKKKVLVIGSTMQDIFMHTASNAYGIEHLTQNKNQYIAFKEGSKVELKTIEYQIGGGAANSAASFAKLGYETSIISKIGADPQGSVAQETLMQLGVNTQLMCMNKNQNTGTSYILPCTSGNNTILVHRGANLTLTEQNLHLNELGNFDLVHITSLSGETSYLLPIITREAKKHNLFVGSNPGTSQLTVNVQTLKEALPFIDVLICNRFEAELLFNLIEPNTPFDKKKYFKKVCSFGPKVVAVTCGKDGVYASNGTEIYFQPIIKAEVISTVGAGDAFSSTFVAYLFNNESIETALRAGATRSAYVLQKIGASEGLLDSQTLKRKMAP